MNTENKLGDLRVWWIPQVPGTAFHTPVATVAEGVKIMEVLAQYDAFQFEHNIKGDYCNAGGLQRFEDGDGTGVVEWFDWHDENTGIDDPAEWLESQG